MLGPERHQIDYVWHAFSTSLSNLISPDIFRTELIGTRAPVVEKRPADPLFQFRTYQAPLSTVPFYWKLYLGGMGSSQTYDY